MEESSAFAQTKKLVEWHPLRMSLLGPLVVKKLFGRWGESESFESSLVMEIVPCLESMKLPSVGAVKESLVTIKSIPDYEALITKLKPVGGFCAETGGAMTLFLATALGIPVSTTHTITGAIVGVGSTQRASAVRWGVAGNIVWAWVLTIPASAFVAAIAYWASLQIF